MAVKGAVRIAQKALCVSFIKTKSIDAL